MHAAQTSDRTVVNISHATGRSSISVWTTRNEIHTGVLISIGSMEPIKLSRIVSLGIRKRPTRFYRYMRPKKQPQRYIFFLKSIFTCFFLARLNSINSICMYPIYCMYITFNLNYVKIIRHHRAPFAHVRACVVATRKWNFSVLPPYIT